jgi:hypothetical protein
LQNRESSSSDEIPLFQILFPGKDRWVPIDCIDKVLKCHPSNRISESWFQTILVLGYNITEMLIPFGVQGYGRELLDIPRLNHSQPQEMVPPYLAQRVLTQCLIAMLNG